MKDCFRKILDIGVLVLFFTCNCNAETEKETALAKIELLQTLINQAEQKGIDVLRDKLAVRTSEIFLEFADWDENNVEKNTGYFNLVYDNSTATQLGEDLADFERNDVIKLLDESIETLTAVIEGKIVRKATPNVDWSNVSVDGDQLTYDGRPVFLMDYTWKPDVDRLTEYFGNMDGFYIAPNYVINKAGDIASWASTQLENKQDGSIGTIFIAHTEPPKWTLEEYGEDFNQFKGEPFHYYDIDNPGAREMMAMLIAGTVPQMAGKKYTQLGYMLANEPRWLTHKDGENKVWYSVDVSDYTKEKFKLWLKAKHNSISNLNALWGTDFESFDDVIVQTPMELSLHGTPKWYDWVTFNEDRVTDWFKFLRNEVLKYDPAGKTHLKIMPSFFTDNVSNTGIDWESLIEISEVNGNDAGANHKMLWNKENQLADKYSFDWRELYMGYDFLKSVKPDQINFNSECHFLSNSHSRDFYMTPDYVRAVLWAAHTLGLNATRMWFWPRKNDGSVDAKSDFSGYPGTNNQQPRVTYEVQSTIMDLNSFSEEIMAMQRQRKPIRLFYSKTSAKNDMEYMDKLFDLYEPLNFEGLPLGFATKNIILQQDMDWDVILIYQTETVTQSELEAIQSYLDNGGSVICDANSLKKNEYGLDSPYGLSPSNGSLLVVGSLDEMKFQALKLVESKNHLPEIEVSELDSDGLKVCTWRCIKKSNGNHVVSIINLGKKDVQVKIELKNAALGTLCKDLLKGVNVSSKPSLKPNEVCLFEVVDSEGISSGIFNEKKSKPIATLYPNPSDGYFCIDLFQSHPIVDLQVFSLTGSLVASQKFYNVKTVNYNIGNQLDGLYCVKIVSKNESQSFLYLKRTSVGGISLH